MGEAGFIAFFALVAWVPICIGIFYAQPLVRATLICFLGGMLFLPEQAALDVPGLPAFDKSSLTLLAITCGYLLRAPKRGRFFLGLRGVGLCIPVLILSGLLTALNNGDGQWQGPLLFLQGLTIRDFISLAVGDVMRIALPFLIGRAVFSRREHLHDLLTAFVAFGLLYSLLTLIEIRLSPQMHSWVYGYGQHLFSQTVRWGGYRPMVFMAHGLAVGLFMCQALLACIGLFKAQRRVLRWPPTFMIPYLSVILFLMKSLGALAFGIVGSLLMFTTRARTQLRVAFVIAVVVFAYPVMQALDWFPGDAIVETVDAYAPDRAESLAFRFRNERTLLDKATERIWFGWGGYGRQMLYDKEMGKNITVTDGYWIIILGMRGAVAFAATWILMLAALFVLPRRLRSLRDKSTLSMIGCLAIIQALAVADLLPNGLFTDVPFLLGGALLGLSRGLPLEEHTDEISAAAEPPAPRASKPRPSAPKPADPFDPKWMPNPAPSTLPPES